MSDDAGDDAVARLAELLKAAGAAVRIDAGASFYRQCTQCGAPSKLEKPHKLYDIGYYPNGDVIRRPMCEVCSPVGELLSAQVQLGPRLNGDAGVTVKEWLIVKHLAHLSMLATFAPSMDALPPDFDERFVQACESYRKLLGV